MAGLRPAMAVGVVVAQQEAAAGKLVDTLVSHAAGILRRRQACLVTHVEPQRARTCMGQETQERPDISTNMCYVGQVQILVN